MSGCEHRPVPRLVDGAGVVSIRDRIIDAWTEADLAAGLDAVSIGLEGHYEDRYEMLVAACPEIAALDHAREGWKPKDCNGMIWWTKVNDPNYKRVLVIDAPEESS